ncbi:spore cortex-lytic enzyme-like [Crassostrea virginica]
MGSQHRCVCVLLLLTCGAVSGQLCSDNNIQTVARVVFGEARGEPMRGQIAVAYSIVNRINHRGYPNSLNAVVYQKDSNGIYQYETLSVASHDQAWADAKRRNTFEYRNAVKASSDVLCGRTTDPTRCATDYCAYDPCPATNPNPWWRAINKMKIGNHYFVCRVPA